MSKQEQTEMDPAAPAAAPSTAPAPAMSQSIQPATPQPERDTRTGIAKLFPKWVVDNATQITNAGLMTFTSVMLYSGFRGKQISQKIYDTQMGMLKQRGLSGEALQDYTKSLMREKTIKPPGWHKLRLIYLLTAVTSFAFGTFIKRKEETPEELDRYSRMSLPEYMSTRFSQTFDPINHSRQTVGTLSALSGIFAIVSSLTQPGGIHHSELLVGSSLATGGTLLTFINDPKWAQNAFSTCWMLRLPFIVSGTHESLNLPPAFKNPFVAELRKTPEFFIGLEKAMKDGIKTQPWYTFHIPFLRQTHLGEKAVVPYNKAFGGMKLPEKRMDIAYPIGQWGNLLSAGIGYLGKSKKKDEKPQEVKVEAAPMQLPIDAASPARPSAVVSRPHMEKERVAHVAASQQELAV